MKICIVLCERRRKETMNQKIDYMKKSIAEELRKLRASKNVSQTAVVEYINKKNPDFKLNVSTLNRYENGTIIQNLEKLALILDYYNVDLYIFFKLIYENVYRNDNEKNK